MLFEERIIQDINTNNITNETFAIIKHKAKIACGFMDKPIAQTFVLILLVSENYLSIKTIKQ